jgi:hypothetical protein
MYRIFRGFGNITENSSSDVSKSFEEDRRSSSDSASVPSGENDSYSSTLKVEY